MRKRRFSSLRRRGATLTSLREVCEITDLLSVGGGNLQRGESGMNRFGVTLRFHDVFFCGFVPLFLAVFSNFLLPMLNHSRGKKREFFWGEKKQILEIFERFISNMPQLFNSFYPVGTRLILLASWKGCKIHLFPLVVLL